MIHHGFKTVASLLLSVHFCENAKQLGAGEFQFLRFRAAHLLKRIKESVVYPDVRSGLCRDADQSILYANFAEEKFTEQSGGY